MNLLRLLVLALLCVPCFAQVTTVRIDASTSNIPTAFGSGGTSKVITGVLRVRSIIIDNRTAGEVAVNCNGATTPAASSPQNMYVGGTSQMAIDDAAVGGTCWIRSMTGSAITTGIFVITLVGS